MRATHERPWSDACWNLSYLPMGAGSTVEVTLGALVERAVWCITTHQPSLQICLEQDYSLSRASHFSWSQGYGALYNLCYRKPERDLNARLEEPLHKPQPDQPWFTRSFYLLCLWDSQIHIYRKNVNWKHEMEFEWAIFYLITNLRCLGKPPKFWQEKWLSMEHVLTLMGEQS